MSDIRRLLSLCRALRGKWQILLEMDPKLLRPDGSLLLCKQKADKKSRRPEDSLTGMFTDYGGYIGQAKPPDFRSMGI